jgi:16S rRNA (uracil1498-N3)-methyltransferase
MATRRFTITPDRIDGDRVTFDADETRHMAVVLRLGPGDTVIAADGRGREYTVRLEALAPAATGTVLDVGRTRAESPLAVTLVQGVPKGDKMESIVRAATELGVTRVVPAITARTIVRLEPPRWRDRARRWQRVAGEAAKQCGRAVVPEVATPRPLAEALDAVDDALRVCLWEGHAPALDEVLAGITTPPPSLAALVGPEGGLARDEVERASERGWRPVRLGPRILRTETAGPAILAIAQFRFGDLGGRRD